MKLHPDVTNTRIINNFPGWMPRFIATHGDKYDYSKSVFVKAKQNMQIICPVHGVFYQEPREHARGRGCRECGTAVKALNQTVTTEEFISRAIATHGDIYDYSDTVYIRRDEPVNINCPTHGVFTQLAGCHLQGRGCSDCADYGFQPNKSAILYYLSINDGEAYKIGITNRTVEERFNNSDLANIQVLHIVSYAVGSEARAEEQRILSKYQQYKYTGPALLKDGNTELFNTNIFNLKEI